MELKDIYELWDRFENSNVAQLELDFQGMHLRLKKEEKVQTEMISEKVALQNDKPKPVQIQDTAKGQKEVKAPLVGVFYQASAPGEKPFVEAGKKFSKGDVLGIIEAMKCMNEIIAQEDGVVDEILVKDAELVEYNQTLLTFH